MIVKVVHLSFAMISEVGPSTFVSGRSPTRAARRVCRRFVSGARGRVCPGLSHVFLFALGGGFVVPVPLLELFQPLLSLFRFPFHVGGVVILWGVVVVKTVQVHLERNQLPVRPPALGTLERISIAPIQVLYRLQKFLTKNVEKWFLEKQLSRFTTLLINIVNHYA